MSWARPGVRCVCVDEPCQSLDHPDAVFPVRGPTYLVLRLARSMSWEGVRIVIAGCPNRDRFGTDFGWNVERFRPLITRTQSEDVALFRKLLVTEGAEV